MLSEKIKWLHLNTTVLLGGHTLMIIKRKFDNKTSWITFYDQLIFDDKCGYKEKYLNRNRNYYVRVVQ